MELREPHMTKEDPENISFDKPGYDGRLNYHAILKQYMVAIADASYNNNLNNWARLLRDMFGMIKPYIKSDDATACKSDIERCESLVSVMSSCFNRNNQQSISITLRKNLRNATDDLYFKAKHLLLPVKTNDNQTFNEDEFMRGSDL